MSQQYYQGHLMSLNFGLYLVEQGIITCDQFCGLVKLQQQSSPSISSIALRTGMLTIRQVSKIYEMMECSRRRDFLATALSMGLLQEDQAQRLRQAQEWLVPSIETMLIDCGLMTLDMVRLLTTRFEKAGSDEVKAFHSTEAGHENRPHLLDSRRSDLESLETSNAFSR